ncbi:cation diffusion facilitator family transporter [Actinomycetospora sp. NBRC 106378]|uniref:cation diffusion facilitator family transporter n=1 Tax=Actinomycetospora sp. NBRC 106378 TaxID=3032208 RepID=UPI0024A55278|nr:cation diffusion facilitator family transporter [Actinomycetospora sp. NBRC 106378]GLZ52410.1 cation diffusion facilitator transporter [Actinomycetospora sp. NBRC 106378]
MTARNDAPSALVPPPEDPTDEGREDEDSSSGQSTLSVILAFAANAAVGVLKLVAGLLTGSSAMLAEAAHSAADCVTEVLLFTALRRSGKRADRAHPFGYGKERFFWAMIASVSVFVVGATYSVYEGITTIIENAPDPAEEQYAWVAYSVLGLSAIIEGISWQQALRQCLRERTELKLSLARYLRLSDDPTVKSVLFEDTAALLGLLFAAVGVVLHQQTGSSVWDGIASIMIGLLLAVVAFILGRTNKNLLIGRAAEPRVTKAIYDYLDAAPEVTAVVDLQTMLTGTDSVLLCARVDFRDELTVGELERACVRLDDELRERFTDLDQVFLEPVPREDEDLRQAVLDRFGTSLADWRAEQDKIGR